MSDMIVEINCQLPIATQIIRHSSFKFQNFSQRYADVTEISEDIPIPDLRKQDLKNRQNSTDRRMERRTRRKNRKYIG